MIEIIIVKYNTPNYENETIQQVLNTVSTPYHLTVYDNYLLDENLSVVWNRLIERSNAEYICLLNPDTVPHNDWLEKLLETFENGKVGAVGPVSNHAGGRQGGHKKVYEKGKTQSTSMLSGFCMVFPKSVCSEKLQNSFISPTVTVAHFVSYWVRC